MTSTCSASAPALLRAAVARLAPGGVLYFSNNFRRFRWKRTPSPNLPSARDHPRTIGPDFERNARIHRAWAETCGLIGNIARLRRGARGRVREAGAGTSVPSSRCVAAMMRR
jgi:hypothetical protein